MPVCDCKGSGYTTDAMWDKTRNDRPVKGATIIGHQIALCPCRCTGNKP